MSIKREFLKYSCEKYVHCDDEFILYRDDSIVAVNKPAGIFVHRSKLANDTEFLLQKVRDLIGCHVYPVHRLDRPTSGVVLFALSSEAASVLCNAFRYNHVNKCYYAIVRGWVDEGVIDYPLLNERRNKSSEAITRYSLIQKEEYPVSVGRYKTARYSLIKVSPRTGRMHQIRRHMKHIFHPVIGDTTYGDGVHNRLFRECFNRENLQLQAVSLQFSHPFSAKDIQISLPEDSIIQLPELMVDLVKHL